jgi:hypothetical protein
MSAPAADMVQPFEPVAMRLDPGSTELFLLHAEPTDNPHLLVAPLIARDDQGAYRYTSGWGVVHRPTAMYAARGLHSASQARDLASRICDLDWSSPAPATYGENTTHQLALAIARSFVVDGPRAPSLRLVGDPDV